ncbi:MAG: hypothetical protein LBQ21_01615, partial [Clostridiales Family XIII bacterium]|nr:hypothetical protein [Clostridiales Family XIII bacterium]
NTIVRGCDREKLNIIPLKKVLCYEIALWKNRKIIFLFEMVFHAYAVGDGGLYHKCEAFVI